ncbi:MAG: DUF6438 domain-containing protein [Janthinobacterium lividum]
MRVAITLALWLLAATSCLANEIDQLRSREAVTAFLRKHHRYWQNQVFFGPNAADTVGYGRNKFFQLDLDGNGLTDLLVDGKSLLAVTDAGHGQYHFHFIDRGTNGGSRHTQLLRVRYQGTMPLLAVKSVSTHYNNSTNQYSTEVRTDNLIFKYGGFIEYQAVPANLKIARISFSASTCYGSCPVFKLTIGPDRTATYQAIRYNNKQGQFRGVIDLNAYDQLLATLAYLHLTSLQDAYAVTWTDDQTMQLEVTFTNGQVKRIKDYGGVGTQGLANLYNQLFALRETQAWK